MGDPFKSVTRKTRLPRLLAGRATSSVEPGSFGRVIGVHFALVSKSLISVPYSTASLLYISVYKGSPCCQFDRFYNEDNGL
jgi:hypothetical protein